MINRGEDYVAWVSFAQELADAQEHLAALLVAVESESGYDDEQLRVDLGHIYAHLNRAWFSRNLRRELAGQEWDAASAFPTDLVPVG